MPQTALIGILFSLYGIPWIITFAVILFTGIILSVMVNWEWVIICLMVIFILAPAAIGFLYFFHALKPATCLNTLPHTLSLKDSLLLVTLYRKPGPEETHEDDSSSGVTNPEDTTEIEKTVEFPFSVFRNRLTGGNTLLYRLKENKPGKTSDLGFIWIPISAFEKPQDFNYFISLLDKGIKSRSTESRSTKI